MPGLDEWRGGIYWEELDIKSIQVVYGTGQLCRRRAGHGHTNGNHALAIIIQVLHQHLTKAVNLSLAIFREIAR